MKLNIQNLAQAGPVYQQVKNEIEAMISAKTLKSGESLPRAGEVARENNIPEGEVLRAYHELVLTGTLTKINKKNMFGEPMVEHKVG